MFILSDLLGKLVYFYFPLAVSRANLWKLAFLGAGPPSLSSGNRIGSSISLKKLFWLRELERRASDWGPYLQWGLLSGVGTDRSVCPGQ